MYYSMSISGMDQFVARAADVGLTLGASQQERLARLAESVARASRASAISQYDTPDQALVRGMGPALAFFAFPDRPTSGRIADLGAGNGALGATIALLAPDLTVHLIDRARRAYTACELAIARIGLENAHCLLLDVDMEHAAEYDGIVFRALAAQAHALNLARCLVHSGGFIGAYHAVDAAEYHGPAHQMDTLGTQDTLVPGLVLTAYRT
jgi:16S rRNA G527 N7-methylase RsmG